VISGDGKTLSALHRPVGERGEVPDWDWLHKTWAEKSPAKSGNTYPNPKDVIDPYGHGKS
ncbi:MAG TPA: hypothetical protein VE084_18280, partial [Burkholderiaceae bacterium]|nr:hypothetical protein [Burkholderiaceae bacterium]